MISRTFRSGPPNSQEVTFNAGTSILQINCRVPGEEKYSKCVTIKQIAENDYNLNIPGYVDTFEAEDQIDLDALANEIRSIDHQIKETNQLIAGYCNELKISTPF